MSLAMMAATVLSRITNESLGRGCRYQLPVVFAAVAASHSRSFDHRRQPETLRTAMATALRLPTSTTSRLPRVMPV